MVFLTNKELKDIKQFVEEKTWEGDGVPIDFQQKIKSATLKELMIMKAKGIAASGKKPQFLDLYIDIKTLEAAKQKNYWTNVRSWSALGVSVAAVIISAFVGR